MNEPASRTWIEISKSALLHNINQLQKISGINAIAAVVKSNAYGHGIKEVTSILEDIPIVTWFCTIGIEEAVNMRRAGSTKKLLAMAYHDANFADAIAHSVDVTIFNKHQLVYVNNAAQKNGKPCNVHIKTDTGMGRLGLSPNSVLEFIQTIKRDYKGIVVTGIFTHLADPNNPDPEYTQSQLATFDNLISAVHKAGIFIPHIHALSSGGLVLVANPNRYSFPRLGTNIYGMWKSDVQRTRFYNADPIITLKPVLAWKARIIHVIDVATGNSVGYARTFITSRDSRIALIGIGYADGYPRLLSNKAQVMINDYYAPVVGRVSMNIIAIDVTDIPHTIVQEDTIVTLIGNKPGITADDMALHAQTLNNEIVTRLSPEIKRIVVQ